ncbi:hypothetical protein [uncultured Hymenobacter sp.]|uniref:hypothetical protein n=1 Tax=uncultured Hymenobacter sp. TaxID=170016 RepID=UPI0035CAFAA6
MKNALLALALFAFAGTASAHDGPPTKGKKTAKAGARKEACAKMAAGTSSCCMKGGATATAAAKAPAAAPVAKSL